MCNPRLSKRSDHLDPALRDILDGVRTDKHFQQVNIESIPIHPLHHLDRVLSSLNGKAFRIVLETRQRRNGNRIEVSINLLIAILPVSEISSKATDSLRT